MDLLYLAVAAVMGASAYGLLKLCEHLFRDTHGGHP